MRHLVIALSALIVGCASDDRPTPRHVDPAEATRLLIDRNWIDRLPETPQDRLHVYRFVPAMGGGVYQDRTLFKGSFELFTFEVDARTSQLRIVTPEDGRAHRTGFHIERVRGPEGTDLQLTLDDSPRGPSQYYGWSAEIDQSGAQLDARLATHAR